MPCRLAIVLLISLVFGMPQALYAETGSGLVDVTQLGADATGASDSTATINAAISYACAGGPRNLLFPDGTYKTTGTLNVNCGNIALIASSRKAIISYQGTSAVPIIKIQSSPGGTFITQIAVTGFTITGNSSATDGILAIGTGHSDFSDNRIRNLTGAALHLQFAVADSVTNLAVSLNEGGWATGATPTNGILCDDDVEGTTSNGGCFDVTFANPIIEGVSGSGIKLAACSAYNNGVCNNANLFIGGTSETNGRGIEVASATASRNTFQNLDLENNAVEDATDAGSYDQFINMTSCCAPHSPGTYQPGIFHVSGGAYHIVQGGTFDTLTVDSGVSNTILINTRWANAGGMLNDSSATTVYLDNTDWASYNTSLSCGNGGSLGSGVAVRTASYKRLPGRTVEVMIVVQFPASGGVGSCGTSLDFVLPIATQSRTGWNQLACIGRDEGLGNAIVGLVIGNSTQAKLFQYNDTFPAGNNSLIDVSCTYNSGT